MRRVLIVSPNFPPKSTADMHRVRASLPHYRDFGWEPTVLCVDPAYCEGLDDPELAESLPSGIDVVRVKVWREAICRRLGFGQLSYRGVVPLYRAGCRLLRRERHDVVLFSTTVFLSFVLGPLWRRRFGCRIVYDFQDPWYDEDLPYTSETVPGRWWKYRLDRFIARHCERFAMSGAAHVIAVSAGLAAMLRRRYPRLALSDCTVLPFPAAEEDYTWTRRRAGHPAFAGAKAEERHWISVGAYTPAMKPVIEALFATLAALKSGQAAPLARFRLDFAGTDYAPAEQARKRVEPLAASFGLGELVAETARRVPYFDAISLYVESDAILLIGSVDARYTASKLLTCVRANKPILALFHRRSLVSDLAARFPNVFLATFDEVPAEPGFRDRIAEGIAWLRSAPRFDIAAIDAALAPWSAKALTQRQCAIFDRLAPVACQQTLQARTEPDTVR